MIVVRALQAVCVLLGLAIARFLWFLVQCWQARRAYTRSKVPGPPLTKSPLGHVHYFATYRGPWELATLAAEYGPIFKLQMLHRVRYFLTDPTAIQQISKKSGPGPYLPKPRELYWPLERFTRPYQANILTSEDGPYWKAVRQGTAPCFSINNMKKVLPVILGFTKRAADHMEQAVAADGGTNGDGSTTLDVSDAAKRVTSDVMGQLLLGEDLEGTRWKESEYLQVINKILPAMDEQFTNPLYFWQRFWNRTVADQWRAMHRHDEIMSQQMQKLMDNPPPDYTIAAHLLSVKDPATGKPLTIDQLKAEASIFMGAGFETTSHAISWTLAFLSVHPDVQQKVFDELQSAGLTTRDIMPADLGSLPYMSAVIKESLRLCPPNPWGTNKITTQMDTQLLGYQLPKGSYVMTPLLPYSLLESNYGPDAIHFKPERWLSSSSQLSSNHHTATDTTADSDIAPAGLGGSMPQSLPDPLTFMVGPRDCIGQSLARMELQIVLAVWLSRFRFYPGPRLREELRVADKLGQPVLTAVHAVADVHVTMQPLGSQMLLNVVAR